MTHDEDLEAIRNLVQDGENVADCLAAYITQLEAERDWLAKTCADFAAQEVWDADVAGSKADWLQAAREAVRGES